MSCWMMILMMKSSKNLNLKSCWMMKNSMSWKKESCSMKKRMSCC